MCDPVSLTALTVAATVTSMAGTGVAAIGQAQQGRYEAQVADRNASLANAQANDSIQTTNLEAQRRYREQSRLQGQQQAAMAANGVDLGFGSAAQVQRDTTMIGGEDIAQIYKAGDQRTKGYEINAFNYRSNAAASRAKASAALINGAFGMATTALGGASQLSRLKANQVAGLPV